ncbi:hypothetical protein BJ546DRAFT_120839 [Cryomyces antarcticus]|uniref:FAD/NAD(P)-binding domain-containing protein n=1 Tax=Cryomyces antarcticus TaxID=329879 RepID=A0ABR0K9W3_9PEZI|nr:hypothetical protein LTR16_007807 [Cryomyces antarcticus]
MAPHADTSSHGSFTEPAVAQHDDLPNNPSRATRPSNWVPILEQAVYTPTRKLRMVVVGAGYSGLMMAHKIKYQENMSDYIDLKIYEKNGDVGGTWLENRYPGVACDVPARAQDSILM